MDAVLLEEVLSHLHNWFERESVAVSGCVVTDGALPASVRPHPLEGQWFRVSGSYFNDGLHRQGDNDLATETFSGIVTLLAIPRPLLAVVEDIAAWQDKNGAVADSPFASESFGGYSYTLKGGSSSGTSGLSGWQLAFRGRLNPWRKVG